MKKRRIKWGNVFKALILIACLAFMLHDFWMLTFHSWFTGELVGWTWYGLITFFIIMGTASLLWEDFEEQFSALE